MKRTLLALLLFSALAGVAEAAPVVKPNILWITSEDNSIFWVSCYGSVNARTPAIDTLAREGFRYTHCFDNAAVCAPTRSTWITGMYAVSNGTQPMRSRNAIPHGQIKYYPDLLREAGYHCTNPGKTDYNIGGRSDRDCWDPHDRKKGPYGWRSRQPGQPFFCVFNTTSSHESRAHGNADQTRNDPAKMRLHAYHPDLPAIRKSYAKYADAVEKMDGDVAACLQALKDDGLYEDTIIIYNSDHGGVMPRSKRFLYSSGTHCPLVVRIPEKWRSIWPADKPGMTVDRLVSFVDMPKTWVSLAGGKLVDTLQGTVFLGAGTEPEPDYHFSFRERADERLDNVRMIRDKQFAYYKNYMPYAPAGQHLAYQWKILASVAWEQHHREGKTDAVTGRFFRPRVSEEFYDTVADFDNVNNLVDVPAHRARIATMRAVMRRKQLELFDSGLLPEKMRERRAAAHGITIYEMVRDPKLYPLAQYLDAADKALARDKADLDEFRRWMSDDDEGMRYWGVVGLHLLEQRAQPAVGAIEMGIADSAPEVRIMAAWTLVNLGGRDKGLACLRDMLFNGCQNEIMLHNVLDWMGPPAFSMVKEFVALHPGKAKGRNGKISTLGRIVEVNDL